MNKVIGLVNFHSSPEIAPLTDSRPLGSTSFLGRYACCDFALSNLCNSGISSVGLLVQDHQRSILKHLGGMDSWVSNTKIGHTVVMYNENAHLHGLPNTDIANIRENDWMLYDSSAAYIVIVPAHLVALVDLRPILKRHIETKSKVTVVTKQVADASNSWMGASILTLDEEGNVTDTTVNNGSFHGEQTMSLGIYIFNRTTLADLIHRYLPLDNELDLRRMLLRACLEGEFPIRTYAFEGFARWIDSFRHYMEYSLDFLKKDVSDEIFRPDWPIYTLTHDTPPALYGESCSVQNSYISNGTIVEGTVINSIVARNVRIGKGAVVRDSIIFSSTKIGDGAVVENALIDKYAIITRAHSAIGEKENPLYVKQGAIL